MQANISGKKRSSAVWYYPSRDPNLKHFPTKTRILEKNCSLVFFSDYSLSLILYIRIISSWCLPISVLVAKCFYPELDNGTRWMLLYPPWLSCCSQEHTFLHDYYSIHFNPFYLNLSCRLAVISDLVQFPFSRLLHQTANSYKPQPCTPPSAWRGHFSQKMNADVSVPLQTGQTCLVKTQHRTSGRCQAWLFTTSAEVADDTSTMSMKYRSVLWGNHSDSLFFFLPCDP